jgi:oligosaccharide repeat unit polymerase
MPNSNLKLILFGSCFILILAPIGIETSFLYNEFFGLNNIFNFFRLTIPILIFFLLVFYYLKNKSNINYLGGVFYLLLYYVVVLVSTLLSLFNFKEELKSFNEVNKVLLPFYCINYIFLTFVFFNLIKFKKNFGKLIFLQFIIITIVALYSLIKFFHLFINFNFPDLYNLTIENQFYNQNSNGLSRILLIITLFIFFINKKNNYYYLSCLLINTILFLLQSKLVLIFLIFIILFKAFLEKIKIINKIKNIFFILIIPIILTLVISFANNNSNNQKIRLVEQIKIDITKKNSDGILDLNFFNSLKARIEAWKLIVKNSEKPIIGYGSQGDRYLTKEMPKHTSLASNSFIYAYASSGVIGAALLLIFYIHLIKLVFRENFFRIMQNEENNIKTFYSVILFFFLIRSIFENSFSLWGIDFIVMVNCYLGLQNMHLKIR